MPKTIGWMLLAIAGLCALSADAQERPIQVVPGTAKIVVTARMPDGSKPTGAICHITSWTQQGFPLVVWQGINVWPVVTGSDGDWAIYNASPGDWSVEMSGPQYAGLQDTKVAAEPDQVKRVSFTMLHGGNIAGRVVDAETGAPVANAPVDVYSPNQRFRTDAEGRCVVSHVEPGRKFVVVETSDFIAARCGPVDVADGLTAQAPDLRLHRGGWIVGIVARPADAPPAATLYGGIMCRPLGRISNDSVFGSQDLDSADGLAFRLGPLPDGEYRIEARLWNGGKGPDGTRWRGETADIAVKVGEETGEIVIRLAREAKK